MFVFFILRGLLFLLCEVYNFRSLRTSISDKKLIFFFLGCEVDNLECVIQIKAEELVCSFGLYTFPVCLVFVDGFFVIKIEINERDCPFFSMPIYLSSKTL